MAMDGYGPRDGQRNRRVVVLIAAIVMAAGAAAALTWMSRQQPSAGHPAASRATSGPPAAHPGSPAPDVTASLPSRVPGLRWADFHGVELPASPAAGPQHERNGLAWGFADTPAGALIAAVNIGVRANAQWGPDIFGPTIRIQVTGLGAAALLSACQASYQREAHAGGIPAGQPLGRGYVTEQAFRWVAYTPADATVDIVSAGPDEQGSTVRAVTRIQLLWAGGDWRVVAPPGGDWGNSAAPVTSLSGYTNFPGQP